MTGLKGKIMTDGISVEGMLDAIAHTVNETVKASWENDHPTQAAVYREYWRRRRSEMLGAEIACLSRAKMEGWDVPTDRRYHAFALVMRLPDGRIGLACHSREKTLAPPREMGDPIREHLLRIVTKFDVGKRPEGLAQLPESCRRVLLSDGLSPDGVETLAATTRLLEIKVTRRKHKAMLSLPYTQERDWYASAKNGEISPIPMEDYRWGDIHLTLSRDPKIHMTGRKLVANIQLPNTIVDALPGRDASCFIDHPALAGMTVTKANQHKNNFVITFKEDQADD